MIFDLVDFRAIFRDKDVGDYKAKSRCRRRFSSGMTSRIISCLFVFVVKIKNENEIFDYIYRDDLFVISLDLLNCNAGLYRGHVLPCRH